MKVQELSDMIEQLQKDLEGAEKELKEKEEALEVAKVDEAKKETELDNAKTAYGMAVTKEGNACRDLARALAESQELHNDFAAANAVFGIALGIQAAALAAAIRTFGLGSGTAFLAAIEVGLTLATVKLTWNACIRSMGGVDAARATHDLAKLDKRLNEANRDNAENSLENSRKMLKDAEDAEKAAEAKRDGISGELDNKRNEFRQAVIDQLKCEEKKKESERE